MRKISEKRTGLAILRKNPDSIPQEEDCIIQ